MTRLSVRGVAVASATAVTAVTAAVGAAAGNEDKTARAADDVSATLLTGIPSGSQAQTVSDNLARQAHAQQVSADAAAKKASEEAARHKAAAAARAKADAEKTAEAAKRKADEEAARRATAQTALALPVGSLQVMAARIVGDANQFSCFSQIVKRESGWNYTATNKSSGAYGLVQALPGSKMATADADWRTNPATQIKWGLKYMNSRYGSPCGAWSFWQSHHWY
ncbi:transglycosylase SLT domain-containing protein [Kitasatospora sp. NPDC085879]|uniref:aggregation-promoting factor C-terminal-like domain-containing protein n=1 Tax=Kitasatospora sp. NPDC085879 TaxID=3154769 RepID=UPI0034441D27